MNRFELGGWLDRAGVSRCALSVRKWLEIPILPILTYHRVQPASPIDLPDSVDATTEQFDRHIELLAEHFTFIDSRDLARAYRGGALPKNPVMVTLDDGYRECFTEVLPVLRRHGARATFFIATEPFAEREPFWWDVLNTIVAKTERDVIRLTYPVPMLIHRRNADHVGATIAGIIKSYTGLDLQRFIDHVAEACGVSFTSECARHLADHTLISEEQLRRLDAAGMDVQSHSHTHRVFQTLTEREVRDEVRLARGILQDVLGRPVPNMALPVGYPVRRLPHVMRAFEESELDLVFTNQSGVNSLRRLPHRYDVRRIAMSTDYSFSFFRSLVVFPHLARSRGGLATSSRRFLLDEPTGEVERVPDEAGERGGAPISVTV